MANPPLPSAVSARPAETEDQPPGEEPALMLSREEAARYIGEMAVSLACIADGSDLAFLGHLLKVVEIEARMLAHGRRREAL